LNSISTVNFWTDSSWFLTWIFGSSGIPASWFFLNFLFNDIPDRNWTCEVLPRPPWKPWEPRCYYFTTVKNRFILVHSNARDLKSSRVGPWTFWRSHPQKVWPSGPDFPLHPKSRLCWTFNIVDDMFRGIHILPHIKATT